MIDCPYTEQCQRVDCNYACVRNGIYLNWRNRCNLKLDNPAFKSTKHDIIDDSKIIKAAMTDENPESRFLHLSFMQSNQSKKSADRLVYTLIGKYIDKFGVSNGVYELDYDNYIQTTKDSWNLTEPSKKLNELNIQLNAAKFLIIYGLELVRINDFEAQTLLRIYQRRSEANKYTITIIGSGKYKLFSKVDSIFYQQLKTEIVMRGVDI